jgi:hypothetical protein
MSTPLTFIGLRGTYFFIVNHVIAGPQSWSYFAPFLLLPAAIMVPPSVLTHKQLVYCFLVPIYACVFHAWSVMGCWDVVSMDELLWATYILALDDPRTMFTRVQLLPNTPQSHAAIARQGLKEAKSVASVTSNGNGHLEKPLSNGNSPAIVSPAEKFLSGSRNNKIDSSTSYIMADEPYPSDLYARLIWTINLASSDRLVRFLTGNKRHDDKQHEQPPSRMRFVRELTPLLLTALFFLSFSTLIATYDPFFTNAHIIPISTPYPPTSDLTTKLPYTIIFIHNYISPLIVRPLAIGWYAWSLVTLEFALLAPPIVYLNYLTGFPLDNWCLHTLPAYFGSFTDGVLDNGVRGLWGRFWHPHLKMMVLAPGKVLASLFGVDKKDSKGRKHWLAVALPMFTAFVFSGLIHMGLVPPDPAYTRSGLSPWALRLRIAGVFWMQPVGIAVEMVMATAIKAVVPKRFKNEKGQIKEEDQLVRWTFRTIRLLWVLTWLCCSSPLFAVPFSDLKVWSISTGGGYFPSWLTYWTAGRWMP